MLDVIGDIVLDSLLDTLKLIPFLYLTYLLMEYLEHRSGNASESLLQRSGAVGPLLGSALGVLPQCGFSAAASGLYAGRLVTVGTLIAVYLSTSDEMLPIMIAKGVSPLTMLKILGVKFAIALIAGFAVDGIFRLVRHGKIQQEEPCVEDICEREHCHCGDHFALSALKHTLRIAGFLLVISLTLNFAIEGIGEDNLKVFLNSKPVISHLLSALVGLIPNCASSVVLTDICISGVISVGAMFSGLCVNAGIGLLVLFRNNRPVWDSLRVLGILFLTGLLAGFLIDLTPLAGWIGFSF